MPITPIKTGTSGVKEPEPHHFCGAGTTLFLVVP
jgi:hypothetical protein